MSTQLKLSSLPKEVIRSIASYLPPRSALQFLLVSRAILDICDDWTVWRRVINNELNEPLTVSHQACWPKENWRRLVNASCRAERSYLQRDFVYWLPVLMAHHHYAISTVDLVPLYAACHPSYHAQEDVGLFTIINRGNDEFAVNPKIPYRVDTLRAVQVSTFCLTLRLLCFQYESGEGVQHPWGPWKPLLSTIDWFEIELSEGLTSTELEKLTATLHAFANKVVGLFAMELRHGLAEKRVINHNVRGLYPPPSGLDIPFDSLMRLPVPFEGEFLESFSTCHLPVMAHPDFLTDGDWTGYYSYGSFSEQTKHFDGVGGDNDEVQRNGYTQGPHPYFPFRVDRSIHFTLVKWENAEIFLLQSNSFQTQADTGSLRMKVNTQTGIIDISHHSVHGGPPTRRKAVITPFGIVQGCIAHEVWLWLWKLHWSGPPYS